MRKVKREEILNRDAYNEQRSGIRADVLAMKERRRVHVGEHLTFLFETADTMRYQIQEMLRIEGLSKEKEILHELKTYNELLGDEGELGCTLLIEIDDALQRDIVLRKWKDLPKHMYLALADGSRAMAIYDERQIGDDRLSAVQYLKFSCGNQKPVGIGLSHPAMEIDVELSAEQRGALAMDLETN
jgi:glycerol-3-phosphate dehydrogenase subunit C